MKNSDSEGISCRLCLPFFCNNETTIKKFKKSTEVFRILSRQDNKPFLLTIKHNIQIHERVKQRFTAILNYCDVHFGDEYIVSTYLDYMRSFHFNQLVLKVL